MFVSPPGIGGYVVVSWLDWMRASYGKAISVAILLFTLAPLGSLYVLLFSFGLNATPPDSTGSGSAGIYDMEGSKQQQQHQDALDLVHQIFSTLFVGGSPHLMQLNLAAAARSEASTSAFGQRGGKEQVVSMPHSPLVLASKLFPGAKVQTIHHVSVVLPWLLTFCLGVLVPAGLSLYSFYRQYQRNHGLGPFRHHARRSQQHHQYRRMRRSQIHKKLLPYSHVLRNRDRTTPTKPKPQLPSLRRSPSPPLSIHKNSEDESSVSNHDEQFEFERDLYGDSSSHDDDDLFQNDDDDALEAPWQFCPKATTSSSSTTTTTTEARQQLTIPGTCAICLHPYQVREQVCWSPNPSCIHAFHLQCMVSWLVQKSKMEDPKMDCPCCRQDFMELQSRPQRPNVAH